MCFATFISFSAQAQNEDARDWAESHTYRSEQFVLEGETSWKNTGIVLKASDSVKITASGEVLFSAGEQNSAVSANGMGQLSYKRVWTGDAEHCNDPYGKFNHAALIAKIGVRGEAFFVGTNKDFTQKAGTLYIGINDCTFAGAYYNSGQFNVKVGITSDKVSGGGSISKKANNTHQSVNEHSER
jgi:hypothetical protein